MKKRNRYLLTIREIKYLFRLFLLFSLTIISLQLLNSGNIFSQNVKL